MLSGAIVHPDFKEVIPFTPEPIIKQDGEAKNDIERNASKRFLEKLRKTHPHLRLIVVEDSLHSNAPHIRELEKHNLRYIIGAKKGDHAFLFNYIKSAVKDKLTTGIKFDKFMREIPEKWRSVYEINSITGMSTSSYRDCTTNQGGTIETAIK